MCVHLTNKVQLQGHINKVVRREAPRTAINGSDSCNRR